jgi:glycosyltransferase involved in cell wall biosynthesis
MKVMTAMYTLRKGGAYDRFIMMVEAFLERGTEVHCLSLTPIRIDHSSFHNHKMYFPLKKVDGLISRIVVLSFFPLWAIWVGWRNKIDLFIAFGPLYAFIQGFSKWVLKNPMVTLIRGQSAFGLRMQNASKILLYLNKMIENIGLRLSDRIITNNESSRNEILNGLAKKKGIDVQVLYNNIPLMNIREPEDIFQTRDRYGIPGDAKVLVTAGILNRGKNIDILINCLPKIEVKNLYLLIVGDSSKEADFHYRDSLQELAKRLGVDKQVIFTGWLEKEELWKIYLASDLFVMPSLNEGMPNVLLEALGCGIPCIGSDIPGIRDILCHEFLMFDPLDEKAIADKVRRFFSDFQYSNYIISLCQERKKAFVFDWKEEVFQMVTQRTFHRGEACQSR